MIYIKRFNENINRKDKNKILDLFTEIEDKYGFVYADKDLISTTLENIKKDTSILYYDYAHNDTNKDDEMELAIYYSDLLRKSNKLENIMSDINKFIKRLKSHNFNVEISRSHYAYVDEVCLTIKRD